MLLSVSALAVGLAFSVPLGIAVSRRPKLAELTQGVAGVIQTVPSLALLVLMVPLLGGRTGFWPAFVALILYSILPILANTVFGCVLAAVLAVVMDQLIRLVELGAQRRDRRLAWIGAAGLLLLLGGGLYGPVSKLFSPPSQYVAGAPFTEQHILSEVMKEKLRSAGLTVSQRKGMAEGVQFLALRGNQIDCCINYTGNIWAVLMKEKESAERPVIYEKVSHFLRQRYGV